MNLAWAVDRRQRDSHMTRCPLLLGMGPWASMCTAPLSAPLFPLSLYGRAPGSRPCLVFIPLFVLCLFSVCFLRCKAPSSSRYITRACLALWLFSLLSFYLTNQHSFFGFDFLAFATFVLFSLLHSFRCSSVNSPILLLSDSSTLLGKQTNNYHHFHYRF